MSFTGKLLIAGMSPIPFNLYSDNFNESGIVPPPPLPDFRITMDGNFRAVQDNNLRVIEGAL